MKIFSWTVTNEQRNRSLEQVLRTEYGLSRRQLVRLKKQPGSVLIDGQPARVRTSLFPGSHVRIIMAEHLEPVPPEPIPLEIIYEDHDLIIINKPAGLVSHPTKGYTGGTLANALSYYWQQKGEARPARLVTRLDKDTSGLVLAAKTAWSHHRLAQTDIRKEYLAFTRGIPAPPQGQITAPIGRDPDNPKRRGIDPEGRAALTKYRTLKVGDNLALVRLEPVTGRTHQLRIHMAHIGCPLLDDYLYGTEEGLVGRTALHAYKLEFAHPQTNRVVHVVAPIPEDFRKLTNLFRPESKPTST